MNTKHEVYDILEKIKKNIDWCKSNSCEEELYSGKYKKSFSNLKEQALSVVRVYGKDVIATSSMITPGYAIRLHTKADELISNSIQIKNAIAHGNCEELENALIICQRDLYDFYAELTQSDKTKETDTKIKIS